MAAEEDIRDDVRHLAVRCGMEAGCEERVAVGETGMVYYKPERMRHHAEEYEAFVVALDQHQVPRGDNEGGQFSLWGRAFHAAGVLSMSHYKDFDEVRAKVLEECGIIYECIMPCGTTLLFRPEAIVVTKRELR